MDLDPKANICLYVAQILSNPKILHLTTFTYIVIIMITTCNLATVFYVTCISVK